MFKLARLSALPLLLLAQPVFAQNRTAQALLAQSPEKLAALRTDPHITKALRFLEVSDSRANVMKKTDGAIDAVIMSEQRKHPGQNATFWNAFREQVQGEIQAETGDFVILSAQLYAARFTEAELDLLISFYSSGIGAKYFQTRAQLDRQEGDLADARTEQLTPRVLEKVRGKFVGGRQTR